MGTYLSNPSKRHNELSIRWRRRRARVCGRGGKVLRPVVAHAVAASLRGLDHHRPQRLPPPRLLCQVQAPVNRLSRHLKPKGRPRKRAPQLCHSHTGQHHQDQLQRQRLRARRRRGCSHHRRIQGRDLRHRNRHAGRLFSARRLRRPFTLRLHNGILHNLHHNLLLLCTATLFLLFCRWAHLWRSYRRWRWIVLLILVLGLGRRRQQEFLLGQPRFREVSQSLIHLHFHLHLHLHLQFCKGCRGG